jgi:hypothetical protein
MMKFESNVFNLLEWNPQIETKTISYFRLWLGCFLLGLVLILPSGIASWFDGLPWTGRVETLVLTATIPFLLILGWRFLSASLPIFFLTALLILKIILLLGSPSSGWTIKLTPNVKEELLDDFFQASNFGDINFLRDKERSRKFPERFPPPELYRDRWMKNYAAKDNYWEKTYATAWNKNASGILQKPWANKFDFPLDWVLFNLNHKCPLISCYDQLSPIVNIEGSIIIPEGKKFSIISKGVQEGKIIATSETGDTLTISPSPSQNDTSLEKYHFSKAGVWRISAKLLYGGANWSLTPVLIEANGKIIEDLGREVLWQNQEDLANSHNHIWFYKILSYIVDGGIIIFLLTWIAWIINTLIHKKILNLNIAIFSLIAVGATFLLAPVYIGLFSLVGLSDPLKITHLGFSVTGAALGYLIWTSWKKDSRNFQADRINQTIFLFFAPATLFFFANKWFPLLGKWKMYTPGNDWLTYQYQARRIIVEGFWLTPGTGYDLAQPFYRYMVGLYHWLFGQSTFAQNMADVWCVLGAAFILGSLMAKFRLSPFTIFISCSSYLAINYIGAFRYHIGRELVENHAMIFMMLAAWFLILARSGGAKPIVLATIFGILGFWTRMDHLGAIAGLAFLTFEPVERTTGAWKEYWERCKLGWKRLAIYWGGGIISILLLSYRNSWIGGDFFITKLNAHPIFEENPLGGTLPSPFPGSLYNVITGNAWPALPSITGLIMAAGAFIGILAMIWRPKLFTNFPLSIGIIFMGLLLPYAFIWSWGYPPRFSIHLLPLAILSLAFFLNSVFDSTLSKFSRP